MKLIVGLGNPGSEYAGTRHNVGFSVIDRLARRFAPDAAPKSKFAGLLTDAEIGGEKCILLKPTTFMNLSGRSVLEALQFFKLEASKDLLVIVDDLALPCGSIRLRPDGSSGGHNGLTDIGLKLGSNYWARLRIGKAVLPYPASSLGRRGATTPHGGPIWSITRSTASARSSMRRQRSPSSADR